MPEAETHLSRALVPPSTPEHQAILADRRSALTAELQCIFPPTPCEFIWEVGCGHGHFLTAFARAHRDKLCVGIDIASDRIARAERKRKHAALENVHFIRADARLFLEALPATVRFAAVYILFPDPWPKSRHQKHRIIQPDFLHWVARRMSAGSRLYFRTDHAEYFEEAQATFRSEASWRLLEEPWPFEFTTVFQSRAASYHSLIAAVNTLS